MQASKDGWMDDGWKDAKAFLLAHPRTRLLHSKQSLLVSAKSLSFFFALFFPSDDRDAKGIDKVREKRQKRNLHNTLRERKNLKGTEGERGRKRIKGKRERHALRHHRKGLHTSPIGLPERGFIRISPPTLTLKMAQLPAQQPPPPPPNPPFRILLIGKGGREHALAWKLAQSPLVEHVYVVPGNGGTAAHGMMTRVSNVEDVKEGDYEALVERAKSLGVGLVVAGTDASVVGGVGDVCREGEF